MPARAGALRSAHAYAREHRASRPLYWCIVSVAVRVVLRLWFRLQISGGENISRSGSAIIAPNHKNFFDVFFVAMATGRPVRYMAKVELFKGPLGWLFPRVGTFPVRRGDADSEALLTAGMTLADGWLVVVFPLYRTRIAARGSSCQNPATPLANGIAIIAVRKVLQ